MRRNILKHLSLILVLAVFPGIIAYGANTPYSLTEKQRYNDRSQLLIQLGVFDEKKDITATVTRAEYARALAALMFGDSVVGNGEYTGFDDVTKSTKYAQYIYAAADMNLLTGYGDGTFRPDNMIKIEEAVTGFVKAAGYEMYAEQKGGYFKGYVSTAQSIGLLEGTDVYLGYDITYGLFVDLIMNLLDVEFFKLTYLGDDAQYDIGGDTFADRLGIVKKTGIVEATEKSSLYTENGTSQNSVTIGGSDYYVKNDCNDLLGYCVEYYIDTKNDENEIIYMNKKAGRNNELTLYPKEIEGYFNREYEYIQNNKGKRLRLPNDIAIIYNGVCESEPTDEMMQPDNGWITLVDNDNDSDYDVLFITRYETYVVYFVDTENEKVYDMFDSAKVLEFDENEYSVEDAGGNKKELKDLKKWNVLSVKQSKNKLLTEIIVCDKSVKGSIERISDDEIVISKNTYDFSKSIASGDMSVGKEGTFFLDCFNRIVAMSPTLENGMEIGYLANARIVDEEEYAVRLKIFDSMGKVQVLYTAEKVKMDNESKVEPGMIISNLKKGTDEVIPQVILFGLNKEGKINRIDTAFNNAPQYSADIFAVLPQNGEKKDSLRLVYPSGVMNYRTAQRTFDGKINITDATIIYNVPDGREDIEDDDVKIFGLGSLQGDQQYNCEFYSLGENDTYADICVVKGKNSVGAITRYGVVTNIEYTIDEENEPVLEIMVTDYNGSAAGRYYSEEISGIDKGDFVEFNIDRNNEIVSILPVYDESAKTFLRTNPTGTAFNEPNRILSGYVYSKENNIISISKDPIAETVKRGDLEIHTADKYKCYLFEDDRLTQIKPEAILDYKHTGSANSKVIIYTYYGEPRILVVYK